MTRSLPLVGRDLEMDDLKAALKRAVAGRGGMVLIGGEAGSGKTSLLLAALQETESAEAVVGHAAGPGETPPYGPWLEVVRRLGHELRCDASALPPPLGEAPGEWTPREIATAVVDWMEGLDRALVVVFEDVHWMDAPSLELLRHLPTRIRDLPVLVVASYRTDEIHRSHPLWTLLPELQSGGADRITLSGIRPSDVSRLVRIVLPENADPDGTAHRLHRRTNGNPLFIKELLQVAARSGGELRDDQPLPQTIQQAIDRRLAGLDRTTQEILQIAAVIGERFSYDLLARVAEIAEDELIDCLEEAVSGGVIQSEGLSGEQFAFEHALVREVLVGRLIPPRRRRRELQIAEALLESPSPDIEAVAMYLSRSKDPRAAEYLLQAGDEALRRGAASQAKEHYERALDHAIEPSPIRTELLFKMGCVTRTDSPQEALEYWREAKQAADESGDAVLGMWSRHMLARELFHRREPEAQAAFGEVTEAEERLLDDPRYRRIERDLFRQHSGYPRSAIWLAHALTTRGSMAEAQELLETLQARAAPGGRHPDLLAARYHFAVYNDRLDEAVVLARRTAEEALAVNDYREAIRALINALLILVSGDCTRADEIDRIAEQIATLEEEALSGAGYALFPRGYSALGGYYFIRGRWDEARPHLIGLVGARPDISDAIRWLTAKLYLATGELSAARHVYELVPPAHPDDPPPDDAFLVTPYVTRAEFCLAEGEVDEARRWLGATRRFQDRIPEGAMSILRYWRGMLHRHEGDLDAAQREAERALETCKRLGRAWTQMDAHRLLGEILSARGESDKAREHFEESVRLAERSRFPYDRALSLLAWSESLPSGDGARERLLKARDTLERLGAAPALARAQKILADMDPDSRREDSSSPALPSRPAGTTPPSSQERASKLPDGLTERQVEVIRLVAEGLTDKEIAARLHISRKTVDGHLRNIFNKVTVNSRAALVAYAAQHGLLAGAEGPHEAGSADL